jgi:hypothetical protein
MPRTIASPKAQGKFDTTRQITDIVRRNKSTLAQRGIIDRFCAFPYVLGLA